MRFNNVKTKFNYYIIANILFNTEKHGRYNIKKYFYQI